MPLSCVKCKGVIIPLTYVKSTWGIRLCQQHCFAWGCTWRLARRNRHRLQRCLKPQLHASKTSAAPHPHVPMHGDVAKSVQDGSFPRRGVGVSLLGNRLTAKVGKDTRCNCCPAVHESSTTRARNCAACKLPPMRSDIWSSHTVQCIKCAIRCLQWRTGGRSSPSPV